MEETKSEAEKRKAIVEEAKERFAYLLNESSDMRDGNCKRERV